MSNPFEDPVAPRPPYQQHTGAQYPPVTRPQGILHCFIFMFFFNLFLGLSFFIVSLYFIFFNDMICYTPLS